MQACVGKGRHALKRNERTHDAPLLQKACLVGRHSLFCPSAVSLCHAGGLQQNYHLQSKREGRPQKSTRTRCSDGRENDGAAAVRRPLAGILPACLREGGEEAGIVSCQYLSNNENMKKAQLSTSRLQLKKKEEEESALHQKSHLPACRRWPLRKMMIMMRKSQM